MALPIDKKTAMSRAVKGLATAKRDKETAVSRQQREDAQKRIEYWQGIVNKVNHMKEQVTFKAFTEMLNEVSKETLERYKKKATQSARNHEKRGDTALIAGDENRHGDGHYYHSKADYMYKKAENRRGHVKKATAKLKSKQPTHNPGK